VLAVLIAALAHDVPEQDRALRRVEHIFESGREWIGRQLGFPCSAIQTSVWMTSSRPHVARLYLRVMATSQVDPSGFG
jgi:hypothetical protein